MAALFSAVVFELSQSISNKNRLDVYEEFIDEEAFKRHQVRVGNSKWGAVSKNCDRHYDITGL